MKCVVYEDIDKFVKESIDFLIKNNKDDICLVCSPEYNQYTGSYIGLEFGYADNRIINEILCSTDLHYAVAISKMNKRQKDIDIKNILFENKVYIDENGNEVTDKNTIFNNIFNNKDNGDYVCKISREDAEKIWYSNQVKKFKERIKVLYKYFNIEERIDLKDLSNRNF